MKTFLAQWAGAFADGARAIRAFPVLVLLLFALEMMQHVIEARLGMFSGDAARRAQAIVAPERMVLGWLKMAAGWGFAWIVMRWGVIGAQGPALHPTRRAWSRYAGVVAFQLVVALLVVYAPAIAGRTGGGDAAVTALRLTASLVQQVAEPLLALWFVNAATGTRGYGPIASARTTRWLAIWGFALIFLVRTPMSAAHQLLNRVPPSAGAAASWAALVADAAFVPLLIAVVAMAQLRVARYVAQRRVIEVVSDNNV